MVLGVNPIVMSATILYIIIFSSAASTFLFMLFGKLNAGYTLWLFLCAGVGVFLGLFVMKKALQRFKRPSLVAFALSLAILVSNIFSIYSTITSLKSSVASGIDIMHGDPVC